VAHDALPIPGADGLGPLAPCSQDALLTGIRQLLAGWGAFRLLTPWRPLGGRFSGLWEAQATMNGAMVMPEGLGARIPLILLDTVTDRFSGQSRVLFHPLLSLLCAGAGLGRIGSHAHTIPNWKPAIINPIFRMTYHPPSDQQKIQNRNVGTSILPDSNASCGLIHTQGKSCYLLGRDLTEALKWGEVILPPGRSNSYGYTVLQNNQDHVSRKSIRELCRLIFL